MGKPRSYAERRAAIARMSKEFRERMAKTDAGILSDVSDDDRSTNDDACPGLRLATFSQLYESNDKRFCVYEDKWGHITSVNAARLV